MAPYPLPQPSVEAALQALDPTRDALRQRRLAVLLSERERLAAALRASPEIEQVWPSDANFLCFRCHNAADLLQRCAAAGLILRDVSHYPGLAGCLRVSIGVAEDVDRVIAVLSRLPTPISNSLPTLHIPPWSHTMPLKLLFVDRDGCLIEEPADEQIDSIAKFRLLPDVIAALKRFVDAGYELVMVTNQDGLGTASFPEADFEPPQRLLLDILATQGIGFREILIDRHFPHEPNDTRKPKIGMALHYLREGLIDREHSLMVGDRETDLEFARNLGVAGYRVGPQGSSWPEIARTVLDRPRTASVRRNTRETQITVEVDLDREAEPRIDTGLGFFDHMLEQLGKHGGFALRLECQGDLQIDEHHTVEDCALALGSTLRKALGDKRGIGRYGFVVPMDETLAEVAIDLSGRPWFEFEGVFPRDRVGELPTELVPHFFRSLAETLGATLHLKVRGENAHHMVEGSFKAVARCLRQAFARQGDVLPSTKGTL
jgi:imidazoleglycerol-phosphate dehydratase/histidinol-phosphatase